MEDLGGINNNNNNNKDGNEEIKECVLGKGQCKFRDLMEGSRESNFSGTSEVTGYSQCCSSSEESSSSLSPSWPFPSPVVTPKSNQKPPLLDSHLEKPNSCVPVEMEMMKERFAKLLLGEDMSGCGNGVNTALAISNAITNLCATLFGQLWKLEPVAVEKKKMWRREMDWLLSVADHIVELIPSWQTFPDGSKLEVMTCRPRSDLYVNLPALRKLDNMIIEILDSFQETEFWYVDHGILAAETDGSASFRKQIQRQEDKWWLPVPRVPPCGLHENTRKNLQHKRDSTNQILKAAMAINAIMLDDMDVPASYLENLPKNARAGLGDLIHKYISSDQFSPECLLDCLDLSSEHQAIEIANRVEATVFLWRQKVNPKPNNSSKRSISKSSWEMVRDLMVDVDKRELLADRAQCLLFSLKRRFPGLPQTTLDMSKIQYNKDVGKAILESYSRVLESLAFNIIARIDDLLYVDDMTKHTDNFPSISKVSVISRTTVSTPHTVAMANASPTPYKIPNNANCSFSPSEAVRSSPLRSPFLTSSNKIGNHTSPVPDRISTYTSSTMNEPTGGVVSKIIPLGNGKEHVNPTSAAG